MKKSDKDEEKSPYFIEAIFGFFFILLVKWLWPNTIPFRIFEFWEKKGSMSDWFMASSYFFIWGALLTVITLLYKSISSSYYSKSSGSPINILGVGFLISSWAGIVEEISFRWILFLGGIITVKVSNFILGGFMGFGLIEMLYNNIISPIADVTTLHYLHDILFHPASWAVGAGMLTSNATFRDGHSYQGILGWIDSWFFGMLMFYILFQYGLIACILIHFAYDMMIFIILAIVSLFGLRV